MTVTLAGGPADESYTSMTDAEGMYSFEELRPGDYTVSIDGFDQRDYEFASTSQDVSVDLDDTETVSFTGVLLRTSGIAGRVSVEGMGLGDITVTLSGADDRTAMTDASGQYAFAGLAAGDYMVSIMVESNAYVFSESETSKSVTVADDESKIVNFEGAHDTSASVSGMLYVDEATKNDMHDEGEDGFPSAAVLQALQAAGVQLPPVLPVPITLHGPGVNQMQSGNLNLATGQFSFGMLREGDYELRVGSLASALSELPAEAAAVLRDFEYGGPAAGYPLTVGVGEAVTQNVPVDITHTTVHFAVHLRHGDDMGDALSGATVGFYSDKAGGDQVAMGKTGETGMAMIRFARAGTTGNMVYAGVTAPDGFDVAGDMQMVAWDPKSPMSAAANSQDVVNLKAEFSFAGATVTTAMGGGKALAGWGIDVLMMGDDGMEAVEGAPEMLDDDGMASITLTAESAADLPMTYYVALDADQDDELDGGENYETTDTLPAMLTGLSTSTEMDAGTLEARYTTQTLKVYVYEERDQISGYTATIDGGDVRDHGPVNLSIRHVASGNRRATFDPEVWKPVRSGSGQTVWMSKGVATFRGLPADANVFVTADPAAGSTVKVLYPDVLDTFEDQEGNGIEGGAFGPEGGFHHTVELCPHRSDANQDGPGCGSFAFVQTYEVVGHVKRVVVEKDDDYGFELHDMNDPENNIPGIAVAITPVPGKNLAGEPVDDMTLKDAVKTGTERSPYTSIVDERQELVFGRMAAGMYGISVPSGWRADIADLSGQFRLPGDNVVDVDDLNDGQPESGPFYATDSVHIAVRPTTGTLYGVVRDGEDPIEGATVTVNGESVETDIDGRYIVEYGSKRSTRYRSSSRLFITVDADGYDSKINNPDASGKARRDLDDAPSFAANDPEMLDVSLGVADMLATVRGTVTNKDGDPEARVLIRVTDEGGKDVLKRPTRNCKVDGSEEDNCVLTGADGTYTLQVKVTDDDEYYTVTPSKRRMYFYEPYEEVRLEAGDSDDGVDFEALDQSSIRGSVKLGEDGLEGVKVTATPHRHHDDDYAPYAMTSATGRFTIWVDGDRRYDVTAKKDGYEFSAPADDRDCRASSDGMACEVSVDDGERHDIGTFAATTEGMPRVNLMLSSEEIAENGGTSTVTAVLNRPHTAEVAVTISADPSSGPFTVSENVKLTIAEGATTSTGTVTITAKADDDDDADETITVSGNAGDAAVRGPMAVELTITDDDKEAGGTVTLVLTPDKITENEQTSTVTATLDNAAAKEFTVDVLVDNDPAYTVSANKVLTFEAGATKSTGTVTIKSVNDDVWAPDHTVAVNGEVKGADLVDDPDKVELTITDDDTGVQVKLELSRNEIDEDDDSDTADEIEDVSILTASINQPLASDVTVAVTVVGAGFDAAGGLSEDDDDATENTYTGTLTIAAGDLSSDDGTSSTITITATVDDTDAEGHSVEISGQASGPNGLRQPNDVTLTINDDDSAPGRPTGLEATAGDAISDGVDLEWTAPAMGQVDDADEVTVYEYRIKLRSQKFSDEGNGGWNTITGENEDDGTVTVTVNPDTYSAAGATYDIQVRAKAGSSGPASAASASASVVAPGS